VDLPPERLEGAAHELECERVGVDPADQERIFDSFQQGGRSASTSEGTGLGLTLSRRIIELHGGRLWLSSSPGEGSTFGLSIPQPLAASRAVAEERWRAEDESTAGPTIVVIEDDPRSAELVELHLRAAGLRVRVAASGEAGLELVRSEHPVAVVLDIHLPGMNGWEVLTLLKSDPVTATVPVVVVSVEPERGRGFALGATEYLVKPVSGEHLLAAVTRLLPRQPADDPSANRLSVVVVDDDPLALKLVRSTLEPLGWEVHTCTGGQQAADVVRAVAPSVVVMDLLMPQVDGFAVIDELRPERDSEGPPIVVLTAKSLTPHDRSRLEGRIAFVAEKAGIDLPVLARRLAAVASDHEDGQRREEPS
jgi:DNA-binding response OmpR family regulator